jgi:hypothetical protein
MRRLLPTSAPHYCAYCAALLLGGTFASLAGAEMPVPIGDPFLVNTVTTGDQTLPTLASDGNGNFLAFWQSDGEDGAGYGIFGRRFVAGGAPVGGAFQVNTTTAGDQDEADADVNDDGLFVVAWESPDAAQRGIKARLYNVTGAPLSGELAVNTTTAGDQFEPSVAIAENGHFLVVWTSAGQDGSGFGVYARLYSQSGVPLTGELQINVTTLGHQQYPAVADLDTTNGFVVVWEGDDASDRGIYARRLNASAGFLSGETLVNSTTADDQDEPDVDASGLDSDPLSENIYVVTWESHDTEDNGVFFQRFAFDGTPVGGEEQANLDDAGNQKDPAVTVDSGGGDDGIHFVVSWTEEPADLRGAPIFIRGRRIGGAPASVGNTFAITEGLVAIGSVAAADDGDFVGAWQAQAAPDEAGFGIYGQRFGLALFADGFESGGTAAWSNTQP